jgi:hypothetical protein
MAETVTNPEAEKRKRTRSPAYPYVNLEVAISRAKQFYDKEARNAANVNVALKHWGFVEGSGIGAQTVAALISFGLMQDEGANDKRKVRLTQSALRILLDTRPESKERADLIKQAALAPKIHEQLWSKWKNDLPSDANLRHSLLFEWETPFNERAIDFFIREYKDTIAFARLTESDTVVSEHIKDDDNLKHLDALQIGDYVQWECGGMLQFQEPRMLREFSSDRKYAFVDGSQTGMLLSELTKEVPPVTKSVESRATPVSMTKHMLEFVVPLSQGGRAVFQWPSSLTGEDVDDLKDSLKILERKISRSAIDERQGS